MFSRLNIIIGLLIIVVGYMYMKKENYQQMNYCAKKYYGPFARYVPYTRCKPYGYVLPKHNMLSEPIKMWKCKIGLPSNGMRYKIYADDIIRYTTLEEYTDFGPMVTSVLKFDNNKDYELISLV